MAATIDPRRLSGPLTVIALGVPVGLLAGANPVMAIAAGFGIAFVLLVIADLTAGVIAFTVLTFLGLLPTFGGPALSLPKAAGALLAISWLATMVVRRDEVGDFFSEQGGIAALAIIFLAWVLLSTIWAESHSAAVSATSRYLLNIALIPIVYTAMRTRRHAAWLAAAFVTGAAISAAYGLVTRPAISTVGASEVDRLSGTIGDPNELAALLVSGLILSAALIRYTRSPALRMTAAGAAALCGITVLLTLSRGGLLALAAALVTGIVVGGRLRPTFIAATVIAVVGVVVYFGAIAPPEAKERITESDGGTGRTDIWTVAWRTVEAHPVIGVGADNFSVSSPRYVLRPGTLKRSDLVQEKHEVTHNMYLQILSELGIVGLSMFVALVLACLYAAVRAARNFARLGDVPMETLSRAMLVALVGLLAADFFLSGQFSKQLWLLMAMPPAALGISARALAERAGDPAGELSAS
jgi:O-antigen ligase